jgi:hypothetical protein
MIDRDEVLELMAIGEAELFCSNPLAYRRKVVEPKQKTEDDELAEMLGEQEYKTREMRAQPPQRQTRRNRRGS